MLVPLKHDHGTRERVKYPRLLFLPKQNKSQQPLFDDKTHGPHGFCGLSGSSRLKSGSAHNHFTP